MYGLVGLVLIVAGWTGAGYKAERDRIAATEAAANAHVVALANEAKTAWKADNLTLAQEKLDAASKTPNATDLAPIYQLRTPMANAKVEALMAKATKVLNTGDIEAGKQEVQHALAVPHADALTEARNLDQKISNATNPTRIRAALMELSDEAFQQFNASGKMPAQMLSGYKGLDRRIAELAKAEVEKVAEARENRRLAQLEAERKRQEEARLAAEAATRKAEAERQRKAEAQVEAERKRQEEARLAAEAGTRKAEAERQRKAEAQAEAARKAEEEYDADGLVLLRKTVSGVQSQFGTEITGTVVNRRAHALSYTQITFNIYDASGAQVGSALANVNGLEPGARWNFKAVSFTKGTDYKFSTLSGF